MRRADPIVSLIRVSLLGLMVLAMYAAGQSLDEQRLQTAEVVFPQLETILRSALTRSPRMIAENLDLLEAEQLRYVSSSGLYPDASLGVNVARRNEARLQQDGSTEDVTLWRTFYVGTVAQPLFHWGALRSRAEIGKIRSEIEQNNTVEAYRRLALEIRRTYLDLIIEKASFGRFEVDLETARFRIETAQIAVDLGAEPGRSLSDARSEFKRIELTRDRAQRDLEFSVLHFGRLCGIEGFAVGDVPDEIPMVRSSVGFSPKELFSDYVEVRGFQSDPRYAADELRAKSAKLEESIWKTNLLPKFNLVVGAQQDERSDTVNVANRYQFTAFFAGVNLDWKIFDGYESRGLRLAAATRALESRNRMNQQAQDLVTEVHRAVSDFDFARRSLEFAESRLRNAVGAVARAGEDFEMGQVSADAVTDAESRELIARLGAFRERATYLRAVAELLSSVGADPVVEDAIPRILKR